MVSLSKRLFVAFGIFVHVTFASAEYREHTLASEYQSGPTLLRVLAPNASENRPFRVVYVLPVEANRESRYGDGLEEIRKNDLHTLHQTLFVAPSFSALPWYADHPADDDSRQESHLRKVVIPFVETHYPVSTKPEDRFLLGFSKSGWGAWSLLLRNPNEFGGAAAWDAPLSMQKVGKYGSGPVFGTQDNFERYRIDRLLREHARHGNANGRLILTGYGNFRQHHVETHRLLTELKVPHTYRDGPRRAHDWHSGWVKEAVDLLLTGK